MRCFGFTAWRAGVALSLAFLIVCGCTSESRDRVIVLALDGMEPTAIDLLMSEGKMPNFARLRQGGAYGKLISSKPILSPIIWTTVATGRAPADHRVGHFVAVNEKTGEELPVTSQMRAVKALWNIFSEAGKKVGVVGWWATWPAESVNGALVSDHTCYHFLFDDGAEGPRDPTGITYPPDLHERLAPMIRRPASVTHDELSRFVDVTADEVAEPFRFDDDLAHFKWAYATAESYRAIGQHLWRQDDPDLLMVYVEGTDSVSHLFGHLFRAEGLAGELAEQQRRYGRTVEEMYVYADGVVGEFLDLMDDDTTLIVLSDHGFQLGALPDDPSKTRDMRRVSEKFHNLEGILYAYGNQVKARGRFDRPVLVDVAPTILALAGLSPARDMPGRVLDEGFEVARGERTVASYEDGAAVARASGGDAAVDPAILERLRALGYLDAESPTGERNLAGLLFEEGRYREAADAYRELIAAQPEDGAARASLAGVLGAMGQYDEALRQLDEATRLAPLNPEGYHNRAVILEKLGRREEAVDQYREALRYSPAYEPSLRALARLGVAESPGEPASGDAKRALELAEQASAAARRGDYGGAMQLLDDAEKLAPDVALIHQYRANVAFLMGDRERARAALRRALEIEPDNALFRTNLEKLG